MTEAAFRARLAELGATLLEPAWRGMHKPHRVRCAAGHECSPRPSGVKWGQGICGACAGNWDAFYVVTSAAGLKFGITSGDARARLGAHRAAGYRHIVRLVMSLPSGIALDIERAVRAALQAAGIDPVRGREYYAADALALVLDVADNYPISA